MDCMFVPPQNSYTETLTPKAIVLGDRIFGRELGLEEIMRPEPARWDLCP